MLQTFRQTDPKPVTLRTRAPLTLVVALKTVAVKRDMTLSAAVRAALATGAAIMIDEADKTGGDV